jgi:hypothetical protein
LGPALLQLFLLQALAADPIVIASDASDPALASATVAACSDARGEGACRGQGVPGVPAGWYARVIWEGEAQRRARIEIRRGAPDAVPETTRAVEFSVADALEERHRAVGLIIASYVAERTGEHRAPSALDPPPRAEPEPVREPAQAEGRARSPRAGVDLAVLVGTALERGAPRVGLTLRGFVRPAALPVAATLAVRGARRSAQTDADTGADVELVFASGAVGGLLRVDVAQPLALELRGELVAERMLARAEDAASREHDDGGRWRWGGRVGLELHVVLGQHFSIFAGADAHLLLPAVSIDVGGGEAGRAGALGGAGLLGVRLAH